MWINSTIKPRITRWGNIKRGGDRVAVAKDKILFIKDIETKVS